MIWLKSSNLLKIVNNKYLENYFKYLFLWLAKIVHKLLHLLGSDTISLNNTYILKTSGNPILFF